MTSLRFHVSKVLLLVLAALVAGAILFLAPRSFGWIGDPLWGQELVGSLQLSGLPLLVAYAAYRGRADALGALDLMPDDSARLRHIVAGCGVIFGSAAAVVIALHAFVLVASALSPLNFANASMWPLLTQLAGVAVGVAFGYAVGSLFRTPSAVLVSGILWAVVLVLDRAGVLNVGLAEFVPGGTLMGYTPEAGHFGSRFVWLLVLAGLLLLAASAVRFQSAIWALLLLSLGVAAGLNPWDGDGYVLASGETNVCVGHAPELCGPPQLVPALERTHSRVQRIRAEGVALGADLPDQYFAWTAEVDQARLPFVDVFDGLMIRAQPDPEYMVSYVLAPRSCEQWYGDEPPSEEWVTADEALRTYVGDIVDGRAVAPEVPPVDMGRYAIALSTCSPERLGPGSAPDGSMDEDLP